MPRVHLKHGKSGARRVIEEQGSVIVIAMVFVMIFIVLGVALYWLISSQTTSTDTERREVKAFNVAEAGVDAGMLALKLDWPRWSTELAAVDNALLKTVIQEDTTGLWDPSRSDPSEFIQVSLYDNVDSSGATTMVANPDAPPWDSNGDDMMFVDSSSNVDDDRHRILILAQRHKWQLTFPEGLALFADVVDSNAQGLEISIEKGTPPIYYDVDDPQHKGIDPQPPTNVLSKDYGDFDNVIGPDLQSKLYQIAYPLTYFEGADAGDRASEFLASGDANGKVVYVKSEGSVEISGDKQIGTEAEPVVVVIDTPSGTENFWDMSGTADFYGIVVTIGDSTLRGTCGTHGAMYCSGLLANKGNGASGEIYYNVEVIRNINREHTMSVNIVPNTWEEYTLPKTSTTVAGG